MPVASSLCAGLVAPDVAAHMREAGAVAQLGDVSCRLARLVGTREPLEVVGTYDVIGHSRECRSCRLPAFTNVTEVGRPRSSTQTFTSSFSGSRLRTCASVRECPPSGV